MKKIIIAILVIIIIGFVSYVFINSSTETVENSNESAVNQETPVIVNEEVKPETNATSTTIGTSADGNAITAHHYGQGSTEILFIGGIHGGYAWNSSLLAYEFMDYVSDNPKIIPENVKVTVIPVLNPDGLKEVVKDVGPFESSDITMSLAETIPGRFNGNDVDLNRNFDCDWQKTATWQNKSVSGGDSAFSEPESIALKNYVETKKPAAVIVWDSATGGVFASSCHNGVSAETLDLVNLYSEASGYKAYKDFDFYEITGDMVNWLAKKNIPAISILLTTHDDIEWTKNIAGIKAILENYAK
jgi:hypothetical protein